MIYPLENYVKLTEFLSFLDISYYSVRYFAKIYIFLEIFRNGERFSTKFLLKFLIECKHESRKNTKLRPSFFRP